MQRVQSAQEIAGCICALVRILPGNTRLLAQTGIYIVPETHFYHFAEIHRLPAPIRVEYLRNPYGSGHKIVYFFFFSQQGT